jgi:hypothetical protein
MNGQHARDPLTDRQAEMQGADGFRKITLDLGGRVPHCPAMFGLNQICGICREIIR